MNSTEYMVVRPSVNTWIGSV